MVMMQPQCIATIAMTVMQVGAAVPMLFLIKQSFSNETISKLKGHGISR